MEQALLVLANKLAKHAKLEGAKKKSVTELDARFVHQLYKAICVPVMDFDPVLIQFSVPDVLLGAIIDSISKNFIQFDLGKLAPPQDLLAHKPQAWYSLLKVFQCLSDCLAPSPRSPDESSAAPKASSSRTDAQKVDPSGNALQPTSAPLKEKKRSVLYSPKTAHLRQKRLGLTRKIKKREAHSSLSDLVSNIPAELAASLDEDFPLKRRCFHAALKNASIHYHNSLWRHRYLACVKAKRVAHLEMLKSKKKQLQVEIREKISIQLLAALSAPFDDAK